MCAPKEREGVSATEWYSYTADADTIIDLTTDVQGEAEVNTASMCTRGLRIAHLRGGKRQWRPNNLTGQLRGGGRST